MFKSLEEKFVATRDLTSFLFDSCGLYTFLRYITKKRVMILMYHGVTAKENVVDNYDNRHVFVNKLIWQIKYLKKYYSFITFEKFMEYKDGKIRNLPHNPVIITFDDGYKNNYTNLFPILKENNISAMIYLPTQMIGAKGVANYNVIHYCIAKTKKKEICIEGTKYSLETPKQKMSALHLLKEIANKKNDLRQFLELIKKETNVLCRATDDEDFAFMTWKDCQEMQKQGVEFGAHTHSHPLLTKVTKQECEQELKQSKEIIKKKFLCSCEHFCYPYGVYDNKVIEIVKKYYKSAVVIKHGYNTQKTNSYALKRIPITNRNTNWSFVLDLFCNFSLFHHSLIVLYSHIRKYKEK